MEIEYHNRKLEASKIYYVPFEHSRMEVLEIIPETEEDYEKIKVKFLDREPYAGRENADGLIVRLRADDWNKMYGNAMIDDIDKVDLVEMDCYQHKKKCLFKRHLVEHKLEEDECK